jgi:hypothetical protein
MTSAVKANSRLAALEMDLEALYLSWLATVSLAYILLKNTTRENFSLYASQRRASWKVKMKEKKNRRRRAPCAATRQRGSLREISAHNVG